MSRTSLYVSKFTKESLESLMKRKNLASLHETVRYLVGIEKEVEFAKLTQTPTLDQIRAVIREEIEKAKRSY